jgi:triacylglycerol lipase
MNDSNSETIIFDPQATTFKAANALLLAKLCNAAYLEDAPAREVATQVGLTNFKWIALNEEFSDLYAIAASCDKFAVLAFRGTKNFKDWMTDLQATPTPFSWLFEGGPEVGQVHGGFGNVLRDAWEKIAAAVETVAPRPAKTAEVAQLAGSQRTLWITGHSLGGALAVLAGAAFSMWANASIRSVNGIYTFGQPRIGLHPFCGNYDHLLEPKTFRFVNNQDLVPRVPFRGWDYADIGQMIHFTSDGTPQLQSVQWSNFLSRTLDSFKEVLGMAQNFRLDVGDHSMSGYQKLVETQQTNLTKLFPKQTGS